MVREIKALIEKLKARRELCVKFAESDASNAQEWHGQRYELTFVLNELEAMVAVHNLPE